MIRTFIVVVNSRGMCDVAVYEDDCMRDIEKSIDLSEGHITSSYKVPLSVVCDMMKPV